MQEYNNHIKYRAPVMLGSSTGIIKLSGNVTALFHQFIVCIIPEKYLSAMATAKKLHDVMSLNMKIMHMTVPC
jgi:hypothetical protein